MGELCSSMSPVSRLPPLATLRAFAVAGRRQSLRDAAAELGVTPSAVSHQVAALEAWLGTTLFERSIRRVSLTPAGQALSDELNAALGGMETALARARGDRSAGRLTVSALPLYTQAWLLPRLERFEARYPGLSIAIQTGNRIADLDREDVDVAIRNVAAPTAGLYSRKLLDLRATPLCSPELARELKSPADLSGAVLIEISAGRAGWRDWLAAQGLADLTPRRTLAFDTLPTSIEAAAQGRGVILGLLPLVWDAPAAGSLVAPFATPPMEAGAYMVTCRRAERTRDVVRAFTDWLFAEMRSDSRRLMRVERARLGGG